MRLVFCNYHVLSKSLHLLKWTTCTVHVDKMFLLNIALQPFQVSQGQDGHNISWFLNANKPLLHSRLFVCVCVWLHVWPQQYRPSIFITPYLAFTGLTEIVHVSPTPFCDLIPCYAAWQKDECSCDSLIASNRHEKGKHGCTKRNALRDPTESLNLYLQPCCVFV